jgi:uncharacterized membrane protein YoaK (UPF0700 family)
VTRYDRSSIKLAVGLAALAGYVDASGFLATGGLFVSFMSGNSTRFAVQLSEGKFELAGLTLGVLGLFVTGVILGSVISRQSGSRRKAAVLLFVGFCLSIAAALYGVGQERASTAFLILAMGAENTVFQRDGEVTIGLTYMTGTLVKLGQQIAGMFFGGPRDGWLRYALSWSGLVTGAVLGALGHAYFERYSLWPAAIAAFMFAGIASRLQHIAIELARPNDQA